MVSGWIGVDLDRTLAMDPKDGQEIGDPVPPMLERVRAWLDEGNDVRIFTARVSFHGVNGEDAITPIQDWCVKHLGRALPVTNVKDFAMVALYDDRAYHVIPNKGIVVGEKC